MFHCHTSRSLFVLAGLVAQAAQAQSPYRIPVVVHVVHDDGNENISDAQVRNGIAILTRNWRKQNPDTAEIVPAFQAIAADMEVEFELARRDPDGNCHKGIDRIRSGLTTSGTHNVKALVQWPPNRYLNIYVVRNAAGLAGHALMPFQADSIPEKDGIVIQGNYFGNIGTSNDLRSVVLSHEAGHYLNLYHVWGGNNVPEFYYLPVGQQANCDVGDEVDDTPATIGWSTCNLNATSCDGQLDNVQNFMDYAYCARMFTQGQKARVHAALNSPVARRNELWQPANLDAAGLTEPATLCAADFSSPRRTWCTGENVELYDGSYHGAVAWSWNVGAGGSASGQDPMFAYSTPGVKDVSLTVSDGTNSLTATKQRYFRVLGASGQAAPYFEGFEGIADLAASTLWTECEGSVCHQVAFGTAANGQRSVRLANHGQPTALLQALSTPRLDLTAVPNPVLRFRYAFARREAGNTDRLLVKISRDCGKTWLVRRTMNADELATTSALATNPFVPQPHEWMQTPAIVIPPAWATDNLLVRLEFHSGGGSDLWLDDIHIDDAAVIGLREVTDEPWALGPNPAADVLHLTSPFARQDLELHDMGGRVVLRADGLVPGSTVSLAHLADGLYLARLRLPGADRWQRIVVAR